MARKPNYGFERREREKARAAKKADRQKAKEGQPDDPLATDTPPLTDAETSDAHE
jgi:hypothetical protein